MKWCLKICFIVLTFNSLILLSSCNNLTQETSEVPSEVSAKEDIGTYKVNENGQSYGSASSEEDDLPDLIAIIAENGKRGYVYKEDFTRRIPKTIEEAVVPSMESDDIVIPVYESDGTTEIGIYRISVEDSMQLLDSNEEVPEWLKGI